MTVNLSALGGAGQQFFDNNGDPLTGGKLYSYEAGTTTPQVTYTTAAGNVPHSNPIILDAAGRVPGGEIWVTAGQNYKFVLKTSTEITLATWDNITGINGTGIATNALYVQYDPAGTGAVTTNVQAKLRQTVSVKDFGAVGDGVADDTVAIQAALDNSTGRKLLFPKGTYLISSELVIQNITAFSIEGESEATTIKASAVIAGSCLQIFNVSTFTVRNISFDSDFKANYVVTVDTNNAPGLRPSGFSFYNVRFTRGVIAGLRLATSIVNNYQVDGGSFHNCRFFSSKKNILVQSSNALIHSFYNCLFAGFSVGQTDYNIYVDNGGVLIYSGIFVGADQYDLYQGAGSYLTIYGMYSESNRILESAFISVFDRPTVLNNIVHNVLTASGDAVFFNNGGFVSIADSYFGGNVNLQNVNTKSVISNVIFGGTGSLIGVTAALTKTVVITPTILDFNNGQFYKEATGFIGIGTKTPLMPMHFALSGGNPIRGGLDGNTNTFIIRNNVYFDTVNARTQPLATGFQTQIAMQNLDGSLRFSTSPTSVALGDAATLREVFNLKATGAARFIPMSTPATAQAGDVYYDSGTNKLRCYDGSTWNDLF